MEICAAWLAFKRAASTIKLSNWEERSLSDRPAYWKDCKWTPEKGIEA
jgi:hypothetical protein